MHWKDTRDLFVFVLISVVASCYIYRCSYDVGRIDERTNIAQKLCSKTKYDFCEQVPQVPIFKIRSAKEE